MWWNAFLRAMEVEVTDRWLDTVDAGEATATFKTDKSRDNAEVTPKIYGLCRILHEVGSWQG